MSPPSVSSRLARQRLTFNKLGSKGGGVSAEVDMGTLLQNERVFLVERIAT